LNLLSAVMAMPSLPHTDNPARIIVLTRQSHEPGTMIAQVHRFPGLMQKGCKIMALLDTLPAFTPDEYLAFERDSESKHEYLIDRSL